jgi:hypothetical protein
MPVPFLLYWHASHAAYLLQRYHAKVVLTERNGWIIPSFIKAFRTEGMSVMHLAHSVPTGQSSRYDYFDYDYYLLFGRSSYEYLATLSRAYGRCNVVFGGPYFLSDWEYVPRAGRKSIETKRILFLGSGPEYEATDAYQKCCAWIISWMEHSSAKLVVKLHPRGSGIPWVNYQVASSRINFISKGQSLEDHVGEFDLVLCGYTNAVLDVARAGVPFVLLGAGEDYFEVQRFGLPICADESQLSSCIESVFSEPEKTRDNLKMFLEHHIGEADTPLSSLVDCVGAVIAGTLPSSICLSASLPSTHPEMVRL